MRPDDSLTLYAGELYGVIGRATAAATTATEVAISKGGVHR